MKRRDFLRHSSLTGFLAAVPIARGRAAEGMAPVSANASANVFTAYRETDTLCPVYRVTPDDGYYLHTFYDICPWSPSQRYLACTRFPFQDREPKYGEEAQICLIDMHDGTLTDVWSTRAWGFQLGSNVQWGGTDRYLYFNDLVDGEAVCVRLDLETGKGEHLAGPMYHVAPDDSAVVSFPD